VRCSNLRVTYPRPPHYNLISAPGWLMATQNHHIHPTLHVLGNLFKDPAGIQLVRQPQQRRQAGPLGRKVGVCHVLRAVAQPQEQGGLKQAAVAQRLPQYQLVMLHRGKAVRERSLSGRRGHHTT